VGKKKFSVGRSPKSISEVGSNRFPDRRNRRLTDGYSEKEHPEPVKGQESTLTQTAGEIFLVIPRAHGWSRTKAQDERKRKTRSKMAERGSEIIFIIQEVFG
jgi:hypothetical protein